MAEIDTKLWYKLALDRAYYRKLLFNLKMLNKFLPD